MDPELAPDSAEDPAEAIEKKRTRTATPAAYPPRIDDIARTEVLCSIRQLFSDGSVRDRDSTLHDLASVLGYQRLGKRVREVLNTDLLTAVRRGILTNEGGTLRLTAQDIRNYDRNWLKESFLGALGRTWVSRDESFRQLARWLGYARTGPNIEETARSLIRGLLREGRIETDGTDRIRRT